MRKSEPRTSEKCRSKSCPRGYSAAVWRTISPTMSIGKRAWAVSSRAMSRKYVILTQRWPCLRRAMQNGSMMEQNQVETTKVACASIGLTSSGILACCVVSETMTHGFTPRARATPQIAAITCGSSLRSARNTMRSSWRTAKVLKKFSSASKCRPVSTVGSVDCTGMPWPTKSLMGYLSSLGYPMVAGAAPAASGRLQLTAAYAGSCNAVMEVCRLRLACASNKP